jgi:hypothetical protein
MLKLILSTFKIFYVYKLYTCQFSKQSCNFDVWHHVVLSITVNSTKDRRHKFIIIKIISHINSQQHISTTWSLLQAKSIRTKM